MNTCTLHRSSLIAGGMMVCITIYLRKVGWAFIPTGRTDFPNGQGGGSQQFSTMTHPLLSEKRLQRTPHSLKYHMAQVIGRNPQFFGQRVPGQRLIRPPTTTSQM